MKLPEDRKERIKVLSVIAVGVILLLVGLFYVIQQTSNRKKVNLGRIEELKEKVRTANLEIDQMSKDRKVNTEALQKITALSDQYLLKPVLGNFILPARDAIERIAQKVGLTAVEAELQFKELGIGDIVPASGAKSALAVRAYTAHVSLYCGYNDLIVFLKEIEASNPMLSVLNIVIQGGSPHGIEANSVMFDVQWPVWTDPAMPSKLEAQLAAAEGPQDKKGADAKKK